MQDENLYEFTNQRLSATEEMDKDGDRGLY